MKEAEYMSCITPGGASARTAEMAAFACDPSAGETDPSLLSHLPLDSPHHISARWPWPLDSPFVPPELRLRALAGDCSSCSEIPHCVMLWLLSSSIMCMTNSLC